MALPIDVVIPHQLSRSWFFYKYTLPSIQAQNPSRIIIEDGPGGACLKRNRGVEKCSAPYVFLCDDDLVISGRYLEVSIAALEKADKKYAYTYSDWIQVPMPGCMDPPVTTAQYVAIPEFHNLPLYDHGGVDWPIVRRSSFQPFDEKVTRYQTWDWALVMQKAGFLGLKIDGYSIISFMMDRGITTGTNLEASAQARQYIQRKHGFIT